MGSIVNKLLLFSDEGIDLNDKKMLLVQRMLEELEKCTEKDKYECICSTLESVFYNKNFFIEFPKICKGKFFVLFSYFFFIFF